MEIRARVQEVQGSWARLVCDETGGCALCGDGVGCGSSRMGPAGRSITVPRSCHGERDLETGDVVVASIAGSAIVRVAATMYLTPVAGLLLGAGLTELAGMGDGMAFFAAAGGALAGVALSRRAVGPGFRAARRAVGQRDA
jgi:sigma-E factor negative regulatory protein RseC